MLLKRKVLLIISLFLSLNTICTNAPEEPTKKPSSATRIARFRKQALKLGERARKFGRRLAGTREYTSEETEWARAKIFTVVVAGVLITMGFYLKPFRSLVRHRNPKGKSGSPSPAPDSKKKRKKEDPSTPGGEDAPKDGGGGKREKGKGEGGGHEDGAAHDEGDEGAEEPEDRAEEDAPAPSAEGDPEDGGEEGEEEKSVRAGEATPPEEEPRTPEPQPAWYQPERWPEKEAWMTRAALVWMHSLGNNIKAFFGPAI